MNVDPKETAAEIAGGESRIRNLGYAWIIVGCFGLLAGFPVVASLLLAGRPRWPNPSPELNRLMACQVPLLGFVLLLSIVLVALATLFQIRVAFE
jgi:hypothetical protein